jgi:hypothetical protein
MHKLMSKEEKDQIFEMAMAAELSGNTAEANRLLSLLPVSPDLAMDFKKSLGAEALKRIDRNYSEVELKYGPNWLEE